MSYRRLFFNTGATGPIAVYLYVLHLTRRASCEGVGSLYTMKLYIINVCMCMYYCVYKPILYIYDFTFLYSPPTGTPNIRVRTHSDLFCRYPQKRILYYKFFIVHLYSSVADTGCVGVGESAVFNITCVCVCMCVCYSVCWFRRRRQSEHVTDECR